jgi:F-type H+-transporting ATPase subunit alpha
MTTAFTDISVAPLQQLEQWLDDYHPSLRISEQGIVLSVGDGIVRVSGLPSAAIDDVLIFSDGSHGFIFDLSPGEAGVILLSETDQLGAGTHAHILSRSLSMATGDALLGRVIDPLGRALDGGAQPQTTGQSPLETLSPAILARDFVQEPMYTGIKIIDALIPVGKGQRQLIIGDEGLGRSAIAIDTVINQRGRDVNCVYVLIGQKRSTVISTIESLREYGALEYTTVVVAGAGELPGLKYLAPYAGCAIAEYWMYQGKDTLVVYDDLSTHAKTYRELSLLLLRPPGREAYPGDIFSLHARLLERATCLSSSYGGGSMTALPVVETQQGEIAAYIPTNLISITDGQIYLSHSLFVNGFRPAIDIQRSVSRVGARAQHPRIKQEAGRIKLDYLQFLELEVFTRFGAHLEASMEKAIARGRVLRMLLKQDHLSPLPETVQLAWLVAFNQGLFDETPLTEVAQRFSLLAEKTLESSLTLESSKDDWLQAIRSWLVNLPEQKDS